MDNLEKTCITHYKKIVSYLDSGENIIVDLNDTGDNGLVAGTEKSWIELNPTDSTKIIWKMYDDEGEF